MSEEWTTINNEEEEETFRPRRSPDENAQAAWHQVQSVLMMLEDMVRDGARLRLTRSPVFPEATDHRELMRIALSNKIARILKTAEIVDG